MVLDERDSLGQFEEIWSKMAPSLWRMAPICWLMLCCAVRADSVLKGKKRPLIFVTRPES